MIRDTEALIDLIRAVQHQAIADARSGYLVTTALPDGETTVAADTWCAMIGVPVAPAAPTAPKAAPARVTVPERCAGDGELYRRAGVTVELTRGVAMTFTTRVDGAVVEEVTCKPQSWKRVQLAVLRAAEAHAVARTDTLSV
jgi:hypothetical protein